MKKIRIVFALLIGIIALNVQAQMDDKSAAKIDGPEITFKKTVHDFGVIKEGDIVETIFEFKNTGKEPLLISKIKAGCGCTVPKDWKRTAILPGESSSFSVKFNTRNKPNRQNQRVRITSNTANSNEFVTLRAQVTPDPELQKKRDERMKKWKEKRDMKKTKLKDFKKGKMDKKSSLKPSVKDSDVKK